MLSPSKMIFVLKDLKWNQHIKMTTGKAIIELSGLLKYPMLSFHVTSP